MLPDSWLVHPKGDGFRYSIVHDFGQMLDGRHGDMRATPKKRSQEVRKYVERERLAWIIKIVCVCVCVSDHPCFYYGHDNVRMILLAGDKINVFELGRLGCSFHVEEKWILNILTISHLWLAISLASC